MLLSFWRLFRWPTGPPVAIVPVIIGPEGGLSAVLAVTTGGVGDGGASRCRFKTPILRAEGRSAE